MRIAARPSLLACLTVLVGMALGSTAALADFGKRYALVIGNSAYDHAETLPNASRDAAQIAQTLSELHFEVFAGFNLSRLSFERLITDFGRQVVKAEADTVMIYYAGHGFQLEGLNRLVPVDAELRDRSGIKAETFALDEIIASVQSSDRQTIIFLDACRNNPLAASLGREYSAQGLAQVQTGTNTFVAFATQPGNVSYDGSGGNSPFTEALLTHIGRPGLSLSDLMIAVRTDVSTRTVDRQVPWDQSSLRTQFYFNPPNDRVAAYDAGSMDAAGARQESGMRAQDDPMQVDDSPLPGADDMARPGILIGSAPAAAPLSVESEVQAEQEMKVAAVDPQMIAPSKMGDAAATSSNAQIREIPAPEQQVTRAIPEPAPPSELELSADDLIKPLQTKLRSIGCYRGAVDGDWGPLSKAAAKQYSQKKGLDLATLDPTIELLQTVERETGTVCQPPKKKVVASTKRQPTKKAAPAKRTVAKRPPQHQPQHVEPVPPTFSPTIHLRHGGIGIGIGF